MLHNDIIMEEIDPFGMYNFYKSKNKDDSSGDSSSSSSNASSFESIHNMNERVILCNNCGSLELKSSVQNCKSCDCFIEICSACILTQDIAKYCDQCLGETSIKIDFNGYSVVGKARLLRQTIWGQQQENNITDISYNIKNSDENNEHIITLKAVYMYVMQRPEEFDNDSIYQP